MKTHNLTQVQFDKFFEWLSPNRDDAAETYEQFRAGLIRFFLFKGCDDAELLADETLNRVAIKVDAFALDEKNKKAFIYGFASNVRLEYLKEKDRKHISLTDHEIPISADSPEEETVELMALKDCLSKLKQQDRELILQYYSKEKRVKIEYRTNIASKLGLNADAMYMKIYRIRNALRNCIIKSKK